MLKINLQKAYSAGLHNSESSKGQIVNINLPWAAKDYFITM